LADLTAEDVARIPAPGMNAPVSISFSPDGEWLSFLWSPEATLRRDLFVVDVASGERRALLGAAGGVTEDNVSLEERLRRERAREMGQGVTSATWARSRARLVVPRPDGLHVLDAPRFEDRLAVDAAAVAAVAGGPILDPRLSPDGGRVAFVAGDELYVAEIDDEGRGGHAVQLTSGARGTGRTHGLAEFVAQEEMGRSAGYWWSPDGARLAFAEVDETHIPPYRIVHQGSDQVGDGAQEDHRYPFAGAENARVRVGIVDVAGAGGPARWCAPSFGPGGDFEYLARVDWLSGRELAVQAEDRSQTALDVLAIDATTGEVHRTLVAERSDVWVNLHDVLRPLEGGEEFLWATERDGYRHLEVRSVDDGSLLRTLTSGSWMVERVLDVSADSVWFIATEAAPTERQLYCVPLAGGDIRRVTVERGTHAAVVDGARGRFAGTWSSIAQPPVARVSSLADGSVLAPLLSMEESTDPRVAELGLEPPEMTTVETPDGATLHALFYRPPGSAGSAPWPAIVSVYGGPHVQYVVDAWSSTAAMRRQYFRSRGYAVLVVDNRGSAGRGLAFEGAIRWDAGRQEVADQAAAVRAMVGRGLIDGSRVGINGWSYGGYMSALALAKAPDVFKAAVAGAPVTSWDGYDTHYTERYMGTPSENPSGYERSSVMTHVEGLRDRALMLVHGLIDENVHFRHTARLVNALIRARIPYELLLFPDERHSPRALADRVFMEERIVAFFAEHL